MVYRYIGKVEDNKPFDLFLSTVLYFDKISYLTFQNTIPNDEYTRLCTLTVLEMVLIDEMMVFLLHLPCRLWGDLAC